MGLNPLYGLNLKGRLINSPRRLIGKSRKERVFLKYFLISLSRFNKNGEVSLNQFS